MALQGWIKPFAETALSDVGFLLSEIDRLKAELEKATGNKN
jgi:uncharacterized small protein (DUF1192 family)